MGKVSLAEAAAAFEKSQKEPVRVKVSLANAVADFEKKKDDGPINGTTPSANGTQTPSPSQSVSPSVSSSVPVSEPTQRTDVAPVTTAQSAPTTAAPTPPAAPIDPIDLSLQAGELENTPIAPPTGAGGVEAMDASGAPGVSQTSIDEANKKQSDRVAQLEGLRSQVAGAGFDSNELYNEFKDFPKKAFESETWGKQQLLQLRQENPVEYKIRLNNTKNQYAVLDGAYKNAYDALPENTPNREAVARAQAVKSANTYNDLNEVSSLKELYPAAQRQKEIIGETLSGEQRDTAIQRLQQSIIPIVNAANPELLQEYNDSPLKDAVTPTQFAALKVKQILYPESYNAVVAALTTPHPAEYDQAGGINMLTGEFKPKWEETQNSIDIERGQQIMGKQLADEGRYGIAEFANRQIYKLRQEIQNAPEEQRPALAAKAQYYASLINDANADAQKDDKKYPLVEEMKINDEAKELTQKAGMSPMEYAVYRFGKGMQKPLNSIENLATAAFGSDESNALLQLKRRGESASEQSESYLPENLRVQNSPVVITFSKKLQSDRDKIINNKDLSDSEKDEKLKDLVKNNQSDIDFVTNPEAGKTKNFLSSATVYANAGMIGDISAFAAQSAGLGLLGAPAIIESAAPLFLGSQDDFYKQAIAEGISNPTEYANTHALIMAAAGLINPKLDIVKRALGTESVAGKIIAGIDEKTWDAVIEKNGGLLDKFTNSALAVGKEAAKMSAVWGAGTSVAHDIADKYLYDKKISASQIVDNAVTSVKQTLISSLALFGVEAFTNFKSVPPDQKAALWQIASTPESSRMEINDAVKRGDITQEQANDRIRVVNELSQALAAVPKVDDNGKLITDGERISTLYKTFLKSKGAKDAEIGDIESKDTPVDNFGYKEKIAAATTETEKEQISKDYAEYIAKQQTGQSADGGNREALLKQAQSIVETTDIKGTTAATIKDWAKNDPKEFEQALQDISAQAADPNSREKTIETFGQDLVDISEKLNKQTQSTPEAEAKQPTSENEGTNTEVVNSQSQNIENRTGSENQTSSEDLRSQNVTNENTIPPTQEGSANEAANTTSQATAGAEAVREQEYTTKTGKYTVKYDEKGNRVVVDKDGNPLPEFVMRVTKKSKIDGEGKPIPESVKNGIIGNILREHDKAYNYNFGDKVNVDEIPASIKDEEKDAWVVEHSNNPAEIASVYRNIPKESSALNSVEGAILEHGIGKVKNQSFKEVSDKNNITTSLAKSYLNEGKGRPLDIIAQEISNDSGVEVTPEDVANMMIRFPNGLREAEVLRDGETRQQAASKFEKLTGIPLNDRTAEQAAIQNVPKEVFAENETAFASEPMPEDEVINWLQEQEKNDYYDDNGIPTEANGQPREDLSTNNENAEGMEGTAKAPPGEVAPSTTRSSEQGDTEKIAEVGGNEPPTESGAGSSTGDEERRTGIKNAVSRATREVLDFADVETPKLGDDQKILSDGKELVESGTAVPLDIIHRINTTDDHSMSRNEAKAMQYYMYKLGVHETRLRDQLSHTTDLIGRSEIVGQIQQISDLQDAATEANIKAGADWGDVGNIRQILIDNSFNPSRERALIKEAYNGEIPKAVQEKLDSVIKERDEAIAERKRLESKLAAEEAAKEIKKEKQQSSKKEKKSHEDRTKERQAAIEKAREELRRLRSGESGLSAVPIPLVRELIAISPAVKEYFSSLVAEGYDNIKEIASEIKDKFKDVLEGISEKDIVDIISGKYNVKIGQSEQAKKASEIRSQAKRMSAENRTDNEEIARAAESLNKKADALEKQDVQLKKTDKKTPIYQNNAEWIKANQRVFNAEHKIKVIKRQAFESEKNLYQKSLMWAGRVIRLSILSGYNVLAKLSAAAVVGGAGKRLPEQVIGQIYATMFNGIAEKAPIEGYFNAAAEAKFYKEFFNPKKFAKNSVEILKTGASDLSKKMGAGEYEHIPILYLPTDLHQIIKDPLKRASFESSVHNGLVWAEKNGLDINDPLIIQSIETAAYKRAQYEIFQEQNWVSRKFSAMKADLEKNGNAGATAKFLVDFMIPVSTVPTNIARRITTTSPLGLIRGSAKVVEAYRKGIENLKPEEADAIMRQLKQGLFGTAIWLIGWFGYTSFGGLYSRYNPDKKRQTGDMGHDEMEVGGKQIPKPVQHALPLEIIQFAATARRVYENYHDRKGKGEFESVYKSGMASIGALAEQIPVVETAAHVVGSFKNPYEADKLEQDVVRRIEPQILRETGIIGDNKKK